MLFRSNLRLGETLINLGHLKPSDAFYIFHAQHSMTHSNDARFLGQTLCKIQLIRFIGRGGMGEVYMGEDVELKRKVAVKFLNPALAADEQYVERFLWEAQAAAKLDHPNIVQTYDVGAFESTFYILMQYVEGRSLDRLIQEGRVPIEKAINIIYQAAKGLESAHKSHIVHRDIKPENLMIAYDGFVKIMDFGLARSMEHYKSMTATGQVMGTPEYISPEACQGEKIDERSDIYSLGITFYESLTGAPPFHSKPPMSIMLDHISAPPVLPEKIVPEIPSALSKIILTMLAKNPNDRYSSMGAVIEDLDKFKRSLNRKSDDVKTKSTYHYREISNAPKKIAALTKYIWEKYRKSIVLVLVFLTFCLGWLRWSYYLDESNFLEYCKKEESLSNKEKVTLWLNFLDKYPSSRYIKKASKKAESFRETLFYEDIRKSANEALTPLAAYQKWMVYLTGYPNGQYAEKVREEIRQCKSKIPILVTVETEPPGASLLINGQIEGKTPCIVSMLPGQEYVLNFYLQGYQPSVMKFFMESEGKKNIIVKLKELNK